MVFGELRFVVCLEMVKFWNLFQASACWDCQKGKRRRKIWKYRKLEPETNPHLFLSSQTKQENGMTLNII